jgi:molybdenum cofactor guanylyltransferase
MTGADSAGPISGAIVAGGASARLGTDKRLVTVDGSPLLARTAALLRTLVNDLQVVIARAEDRTLVTTTVGGDVTLTLDAREGVGPAAGLEAALTSAGHDHVLVVATDHPALSAEVLALLVARARASSARAVALEGARGGEPFLAVYRRDALGAVSGMLDAGTRRMQDVLAGLAPEIITAAEWRALDPAGATTADVDTPEDLARLR